jgi:hypothetical protein
MSTISSATFTVFAYNRSGLNQMGWEYGDGMKIKRITSAWTEGTKGADSIWYSNNAVAWANQPTVTTTNQVVDTTKISDTRPSHGKAYTFTITDIVKQWAPAAAPMLGGAQTNNGIRLEMTDPTASNGGGVEFCSREDNTINGGTSYDAYIDIVYAEAPSVVLPVNDPVAPTAAKVATIVNLNDTTNWTSSTKLARPNLDWGFAPSTSAPAAQAQWRVRIYSLAAAGDTLFDSGFVSEGSHASDTAVDIPLDISAANAPYMPGGLTKAITNVTWSAGTATYTATGHGLDTGMYVNVTGLNEDSLNISNALVTVIDANTFTADIADPGEITGTSGTVSTIWASTYKGLENNTNYWWTIQTRDTNGLEAAESARTQFKVLFSNQQLQYAYPGGTASTFVHNIGATPSGTAVERLYGSTNTSGATPGTWYSSLSAALTNRSTNAYLVVAVRMAVLNNSNTAISDPTVSGISMSYVAAVSRVPDKWEASSANITVELSDEIRRFGTQAAKVTAVTVATHSIRAYRFAAGDGVAVVPHTTYTFSFYVKAEGVSAPITGQVYSAGAGGTLLATSFAHTTFDADSDGWRRMYVSFNSGENKAVEPYIYIDASVANTAFYVDGAMLEEGTVIRSYSPGLVNSPALIEGGGIQVDASEGGTFRLRGSNGGSQNIVTLGTYGLKFGSASPTPELYSYQASELSLNGWLRSWRSASTDFAFGAAVTGDTYSRGMMLADGKIEWGAGGGNLRDTNLYRSEANVLKTDDTFNVPSIVMPGSTSGTITINPTAVAGTTVLTLPATTGTLALTSQIPSITGTTFDLTGDVTVTAAAFTIGGDNVYSVAVNNDSHTHTAATLSDLTLGTDTIGNYIATITSANSLITVSGSGVEGGAVTLTADTSPTFVGLLTASAGAELSGAVDLNSTVSATSLSGTSSITNSQDVRIFFSTGGGLATWRVFRDTSSERYKTNIVYVNNSDSILDVQPVTYHDKVQFEEIGSEAPRQYGFLAEDMAENVDGRDYVVFNEDGDPEAIQYSRLVVPLHSAMRKLRSRIDELEARLAELESNA